MSTEQDQKQTLVWKFGFGSNMSVAFITKKKGIPVQKHFQGIAHGWKLAFPKKGMDCVEPAFATIYPDPDSVVHGVVCGFLPEDAANMDKQEGGGSFYQKADLEITTYSGETIQANAYTAKAEDVNKETASASKRYMNILINGAIESELDASWVQMLKSLPCYTPDEATLARRKAALPPLASLPAMTIAELKQHDGSDPNKPVRMSSCGYIIEGSHPYFAIFKGRDVTSRNLNHFRGINLDKSDDKGMSPFPILKQLPKEECDYLHTWLDHLLLQGKVVAKLSEFHRDQQMANQNYYEGHTSVPFHHAFPTHSLAEARAFYKGVLGLKEGRSSEKWIDFNLFGSQIVAHLVAPDFKAQDFYNSVDGDEVPVPHFGACLTVPAFQALAARLDEHKVTFIVKPHLRFEGQPGAQWTMFFKDPSNNNLEFKAMLNPENLFASYTV